MKRTLIMFAMAASVVVAGVGPASAHVELQPPTATVGATTEFNLFVEDEKSDAGTTKVELFFPDDLKLTVAAAKAPDGWTVTVQGGEIGSTATGLTWTGPAIADSVNVKLTLGPLPADEGSLQFRVLQTYDNGDVDRWIGVKGAADPGPTLQLLAAGATTTTGVDEHGGGDHHATETTTADHHGGEGNGDPGHHDAETTTSAAVTTTTAASGDDDSSNAPAVIGIIAAALVLGGGLFFAAKSRKKADNTTTP